MPVIRYALVRNARDRENVEAYLPGNYKVAGDVIERDGEYGGPSRPEALLFVIEGKDDHGWTLDGYVIPRFASGLIWAEEIDLSHPVMKRIPARRPRPDFDPRLDYPERYGST